MLDNSLDYNYNGAKIYLMDEHIVAKESQIYLFKNVPLYCQSKGKDFVLYKKPGDTVNTPRLNENNHPELFVKSRDKKKALEELFDNLNNTLAAQAMAKDLQAVRSTLQLIIGEALNNVEEAAPKAIPQTINVLFEGYHKQPELLKTLEILGSTSNIITAHTVNVLILAFRYCFFQGLSEKETKKLALCALFHDIGTSEIDQSILDSNDMLTDEEFEIYTTHTSKGCDLLLKQKSLPSLVSTVAQEHHERIDGSGYPLGRTNICFESQLIGLIDCYEPLTYRDKTHRKAKIPFDSFQLLKDEVLQSKFSKTVFSDLCSCMTDKGAPELF